ncbi:MAG: hypothetical protein KGD63_10330 [Candidatus Lokiarchaeota archaeon]|nr:hypothetical protein [Candidatus Lokiarchaeota archaeon]
MKNTNNNSEYTEKEIKKTISKDFKWMKKEFKFIHYDPETLLSVKNNIIQGIYFQRSYSKRAVCITFFIQPLFIPENFLILNYGFRMDKLIKGQQEWVVLDKKGINKITKYVKKIGKDFFNSHDSPAKIIESAKNKKYKYIWEQDSWSIYLCLAYCYAYEGKNSLFYDMSNKIKAFFEGKDFDWAEKRISQLDNLEKSVQDGKQKELFDKAIIDLKQKLKLK